MKNKNITLPRLFIGDPIEIKGFGKGVIKKGGNEWIEVKFENGRYEQFTIPEIYPIIKKLETI